MDFSTLEFYRKIVSARLLLTETTFEVKHTNFNPMVINGSVSRSTQWRWQTFWQWLALMVMLGDDKLASLQCHQVLFALLVSKQTTRLFRHFKATVAISKALAELLKLSPSVTIICHTFYELLMFALHVLLCDDKNDKKNFMSSTWCCFKHDKTGKKIYINNF